LRKVIVACTKDISKPGQIWLIGVCGSKSIGIEWWAASSSICNQRSGVVDGEDGLGIQVPFFVGTSCQLGRVELLIVRSACDDIKLEVVSSLSSFWSELLQENRNVRPVVGFSEVVGQSNLVLAGSLWLIVNSTVESTQTEWSNAAGVADTSSGRSLVILRVYAESLRWPVVTGQHRFQCPSVR